MNEQLKPCPFCGEPFEIKCAPTDWGHWYWLHDNPSCPMYRKDAGNGYMYIGKANLCKELNQRAVDDAQAARIRELEAEARWIPVSERLPESEYPEDGESISVQGFCNAGIWDGVLSPIYYIYRTGHWYFGQSRLDTVTHWRPLPEPPAAQDKTE